MQPRQSPVDDVETGLGPATDRQAIAAERDLPCSNSCSDRQIYVHDQLIKRESSLPLRNPNRSGLPETIPAAKKRTTRSAASGGTTLLSTIRQKSERAVQFGSTESSFCLI